MMESLLKDLYEPLGGLQLDTWSHISPDEAALINATIDKEDVLKGFAYITQEEYLANMRKKEQETGVLPPISLPPHPEMPAGTGEVQLERLRGPQSGMAAYKGVPHGVRAVVIEPQQELQHLLQPQGAEQRLEDAARPDQPDADYLSYDARDTSNM